MADGGKLLVFVGLDSSGKSTQIDRLEAALLAEGTPSTRLWSRVGYTPGITALKTAARRVLGKRPGVRTYPQRASSLGNPWKRRLWVTLSLLDLLVLYGARVRIWLARGRVVICDRYLVDALLDLRINFPQDRVEHWLLWRLLTRVTPTPDLVLLLTIPVELSLGRSATRGRTQESAEVLERRSLTYRQFSEDERWCELDAARGIQELTQDVDARVRALLH